MRGLRLGLSLGRGQVGTHVSVTISGLTDGEALEGTHGSITSSVSAGTITARRWGTTTGGSDLGTGTNPTDFTGTFPGTLYAGCQVDGVWYEASATVTTNDFVLTVETTGASESFTMPFRNAGTYNGTIDWGDGSSSTITAFNDADLAHTYATADTYRIRCRGQFGAPLFNGATDRAKLRTVENYGTIWTSSQHLQAFTDCDGLTSFTFGRTDTSAIENWFAFFAENLNLASVDATGASFAGATNLQSFAANSPELQFTGLDLIGATPTRMDEAFYLTGAAAGATTIDLSGVNIGSIANQSGLGTGGFFNLFQAPAGDPTTVMPSALYDATLIAWAAQLPITVPFNLDATPTPEGVVCDFQQSAGTAASTTARRALASAGFWIEDANSAGPEAMSAPSLTVDSASQITVARAARPYADGPITSYDLRYSTDEATWTTVTGISASQAITGLTASTLYYVQTRAVSPGPWNAGAWSPSQTATTSAASGFSLEEIAEEPVITVTSGNISVTIGSGTYAGTYTTRVTDSATLTVTMVEAAPTPIVLPAVSGTPTPGQTLTVTPGLWIYAGADPGDQTFQHQLGGVDVTGETGLTYFVQYGDVGSSHTVEETFDGVTIESAGTTITADTSVLADQDSLVLLDESDNVLLDHAA